jgi:hypothetical protein
MEQATTEPPLRPRSPRKLERWHVVLMVIGVCLLIGVVAVVESGKHRVVSGFASSEYTVSVTSGTGDNADVDVNHDGEWSQASNQSLPWSETLRSGYLSVAAQGLGTHGSITCTIRNPNGSVRDTQTASGPYVEVACNANSGNSGSTGNIGNSGVSGNS